MAWPGGQKFSGRDKFFSTIVEKFHPRIKNFGGQFFLDRPKNCRILSNSYPYCGLYTHTVGRINFKDKKFRGFRGYLLNLEIKYPCNFLYTRSRFFVQHVHVVGKWLALWKYFKRAAEVKISLYHRLLQFISSNILM